MHPRCAFQPSACCRSRRLQRHTHRLGGAACSATASSFSSAPQFSPQLSATAFSATAFSVPQLSASHSFQRPTALSVPQLSAPQLSQCRSSQRRSSQRRSCQRRSRLQRRSFQRRSFQRQSYQSSTATARSALRSSQPANISSAPQPGGQRFAARSSELGGSQLCTAPRSSAAYSSAVRRSDCSSVVGRVQPAQQLAARTARFSALGYRARPYPLHILCTDRTLRIL